MWTHLMAPNTFTSAVHHKEKINRKVLNIRIKSTCLNTNRKYYFNFLALSRSISQIVFTSMPLDINKLGSCPNFANSKEAARGQEPGTRGRTMSREGLRVSGRRREKGLCAAVPGLQGRGRESAVGPSHRPGSHPAARRPRFPSSRT